MIARHRPKPNLSRDALHDIDEPMDTRICKDSIEVGVNDAVVAECEGQGKRGRPLTGGWLTRERGRKYGDVLFDWTGGKPLLMKHH